MNQNGFALRIMTAGLFFRSHEICFYRYLYFQDKYLIIAGIGKKSQFKKIQVTNKLSIFCISRYLIMKTNKKHARIGYL